MVFDGFRESITSSGRISWNADVEAAACFDDEKVALISLQHTDWLINRLIDWGFNGIFSIVSFPEQQKFLNLLFKNMEQSVVCTQTNPLKFCCV